MPNRPLQAQLLDYLQNGGKALSLINTEQH